MTAPATSTVSVRMYNVGFGDAFLVTVRRNGQTWRQLVDCGAHSHGQKRPIKEAVAAIIDDLVTDSHDGVPRLDVVVATHRHRDHIVGFSEPAWEQVEVGEVWVPFVEDVDDEDARKLRQRQTDAARRLLALVEAQTFGVEPDAWSTALADARAFAINSLSNAEATDRLLGQNGQRFRNPHTVRYLPAVDPTQNVISTSVADTVVHVLGPSRDPAALKLMDPPTHAGWHRLDVDDRPDGAPLTAVPPLFSSSYVVRYKGELSGELLSAKESLKLGQLTNDAGLLTAASVLENAVNNTSLFFVLDVAGTRLLFPGDSQYGAWMHVLDNPKSVALIRNAAFYKIGHHGSHNATPKKFIEEILQEGIYAMLPWGLVKNWEKTIPFPELLDALTARHHHVIRADAPQEEPGKVTVHGDLWSEVTFAAE